MRVGRALRVTGIMLILLAGHPAPAPVAAVEVRATLGLRADGWYATGSSGCPSALGCFPIAAPKQTYPPDTLHVAATLGQESARSYVALDLSRLPIDAELTGGRLLLPLSADEDGGTAAPETATLRACLSTAVFADDADGSTRPPPPVDCETSSTATLNDTVFTLELDPFVDAWNAGTPDNGIALLPHARPPEAWHLAFDARSKTGPDVRHITADLTYLVDDIPKPALTYRPPPEPQSQYLPPPLPPPTPPSPPPPSDPPVAPPQVASNATAPPPQGFRYPVALLLPLLFLAAWLFLTRTFTRDVAPVDTKRTRSTSGRLFDEKGESSP